MEPWSFRQETYHFPPILLNKVLPLILTLVLSAEWQCATFPTEGSVYLLNDKNSCWVPRFGKLSSAKSRKDTRKQFLSFNFASVASTTDAFFFPLVKIIRKSFSSHMSLTPEEEMEKIKVERTEKVIGILTKVLCKLVHCCASPSWSLKVDFQPWDKGRIWDWTGGINTGIPFVRFLCILGISLTEKQLGVNWDIKFDVCRFKC